ncbi:hypothetical protein ACFT8W_35940 [Streptomyces hygroscopicus]|uniref:hypothetical protein n=1 Tax=Streptomyces hygroscopicus TaxID=1912 RepID=UPI0036270D83
MRGEPTQLQDFVFGLTLPQPGGYMTDALDVPPVTTAGLDGFYILGTDDTSLARPGTEFAARLGVEPRMAPGGHMALLNHPEDIAAALLELL